MAVLLLTFLDEKAKIVCMAIQLNNKYSHVFWDWNGTLLDDVDYAVAIMNSLLQKRGLRIIENIEKYRQIFCFPVIEYYSKLGFDFEKESFFDAAREFTDLYTANFSDLKLRKFTKDIVQLFAKNDIKQIVLSATEQEMLINQLQPFNISCYFEDILGLKDIYAAGKTELAKEYIKSANIEKALFVGDTLHDKHTAEAMGIDYVLLVGGHASINTLQGCKVLDDIRELKAIVGQK